MRSPAGAFQSTMRGPKVLVALLVATLAACQANPGNPRAAASSKAAASSRAPAATPAVRASAPALASSSPPKPAAPAAPAASAASAAETPSEPDAFEKFYEKTVASCDVNQEPMTTADMVAHARGVERCADRRIRRILARLEPDERKALTAGPETRRAEPSDWYPLWNRFIDGACYIDDALKWTRGSDRPAGTMRHSGLPACFSGLTVSALQWLDSYAKNDAVGFARRVSKLAASGEKAKALQKTLSSEAAYFSEHAPEDSSFDDACTHYCPLYDADYRKLARTLENTTSAAPELARAMCRSWPELARALGGFGACVDSATLFYLAQAGTESGMGDGDRYYEGLAKGEARETSSRVVPPAKDPDYARFADPLYARCEHDPNRDCMLPETRTACHERELSVEVARAKKRKGSPVVRDFERRFRSFTTSLCFVEGLSAAALFVSHQREFSETQCRWLANTRASFLFHSWAEDDAAAFRRHIIHRESWSRTVTSELGRLARDIKKPCVESKWEPICRHTWIKDTAWKRAERAMAELEPRARSLGEKLCRGWPSLAESLGPSCSENVRAYFLSYGHGIGMLQTDS